MKRIILSLLPFLLFPALIPFRVNGGYTVFNRPILQMTLVIIACFIIYLIAGSKQPGSRRAPSDTKMKALLIVFLVSYFVFFAIMNYVKFNHFGMGSDLTKFSQSFWTTLHEGKCFYNSAEGNHFGNHFSPFLFLLLPLYALFPSPLTLVIIKTGAITASGVPLYLLARKYLGNRQAFCIVIGYLLYWPILNQNLFEFYELHFSPLLVLWMLYFFDENKFGLFLIFLCLLLSLREEMGLIAVLLGICSYFLGRGPRWSVIPFFLGTFWLAGSFFLAIPYFSASGKYIYTEYFPSSFSTEALQEMSNGDRPFYLYLVLFPLCFFLPFFSWEWLLSLPLMLGLLITSWKPARMVVFHYHLALAPFLWGSIIHSLYRFQKKSRVLCSILLVLLILFVLEGSIIIYNYERVFTSRGGGLKEGDQERIVALKEAISLIPPEASCLVPEYVAPHLAHRKELYFRTRVLKLAPPEFILLDEIPFLRKAWAGIRIFLSGQGQGQYREIYNQGSVTLYRKRL